jgi:hypothetical protein
MKKVYNLLLNEKSAEHSRDKADLSEDWRDRLAEVMGAVEGLRPISGEWIFGNVKSAMRHAIDKMQKYDLNDDTVWDDVFTQLKYVLGIYSLARYSPGGAGDVFKALHDGLDTELKKGKWRNIKTRRNRDNKIDSIMKELGDRLNGLDGSVFEAIVENAGGMRRIIDLLQGNAPM